MDTPREQNFVTARFGVLNTDTVQGQTLIPISVSAAGLLRTNASSTISFTMVPVDPRDENYATCWLFEGLDGLTYPAVVDASGALLVNL